MPRREFLYDIRFWEARRIVRGHRKRHLTMYQLLAENVFASTFAFRGSEGKTPKDMFPSLFEDDDYSDEPPLTEEEREELLAEIDAWNAQHQGETQP